MKEITADIWDMRRNGGWVAIPTNGTVTKSGHLVMGRGVARQAKDHFCWLPKLLGERVEILGNNPIFCLPIRIVTFPTKNNWRSMSSLTLIRNSALLISEWFEKVRPELKVFLPRVGCGLGGLSWDVVKPILEVILRDNFTVCTLEDK